jgi:hypothetical protein
VIGVRAIVAAPTNATLAITWERSEIATVAPQIVGSSGREII